jgi:single-strand DNA-binding protein
MSNQLNGVHIEGNLTRKPELRYSPNGTAVTTFGLANNRHRKQGEEDKEDVCFVDVVVFNKTAEYCAQYLNKGDRVLVSGRLQQRRWEKDWEKRSKHVIVAYEVFNRSNHQGDEQGQQWEEEPRE